MPTLPVLTESMRKVLQQAQVEARHLNQEFVSTEHLLLALLHSEHSDVSRVLRSRHVDTELLRTQISEFLPFSESAPKVSGDLPLSPKAQRLINSAVVKSRALREPKLCTRVFMQTLLDEGNPLLEGAIRAAGTTVNDLREALSERSKHPEE